MNAVKYSWLGAIVLAIASIVIGAEEKGKPGADGVTVGDHKMLAPGDIQWGEAPPSLPPGAKVAVLSGDPGKPGLYTVRMRAPAGYKIPPHTHPTSEQITVLSGAFHMGTGDKFDESAGHAMGPGSFMVMPAGTKHFAWAKEESVIQVHAEGPLVITYVNPADDPRNAKK